MASNDGHRGLDSAARAVLRKAGSAPKAPGPQVGVETGFELRNGVQVGPDAPLEYGGDGRVVDASQLFSRPQTHPLDGASEVDCEQAGSLNSSVTARRIRPVGGDFDREFSPRPGHPARLEPERPRLTVIRDQPDADMHETVTPNPQTVGSYQQWAGDAVSQAITNFTPDFPSGEWAAIEDFVRSAVEECGSQTAYSARELLTASARHIRWCWATGGLPLEREVIFHRNTIAEYIAHGCAHMSKASAGNRRSQLLRMSELLLSPQQRTGRLAPLPPPDPSRPYSASDVTALRSWAIGQSTQYMVVNCHVLLALGFGAGLSAAEITAACASDVVIDSEGVLVSVRGSRARLVPVLAEWEQPLIEVADAAIQSELYVFRPRRESTHKNLITNFIDKTNQGRVRVSTQRMRATWIVTHLSAGSPVKPLIAAAGVDSLEALTRYLRFVPDSDISQWRAAFRSADTGE